MTTQKIISTKGKTLYEGTYSTFSACLESAVAQKIPLNHADLKHYNLCNIQADGATLAHTDFTGANLTGANLSESDLNGSIFKNADLYNTCMAASNLSHASFKGASFGGTDITASNLSHCLFSTLSCFTLDFLSAETMDLCIFEAADKSRSTMSKPPVIITGYDTQPIIFFDTDIRRGHEKLSADQWIGIFRHAGEDVKMTRKGRG